MPDNPYKNRDTFKLSGPIDAGCLHPITASANTLKTSLGEEYVPRALWADVAGTIAFTLPDGRTISSFPLIAGPNPIGGMTKITTITTIGSLWGVSQ